MATRFLVKMEGRANSYTVAWSDLISFALLNPAGLIHAVASGTWRLRQIYDQAYFPLAFIVIAAGSLGLPPRVKASTKGEGTERRYFYGTVWAVCAAQPVLGLLWKVLPRTHAADAVKLAVFLGVVVVMGVLGWRGVLP